MLNATHDEVSKLVQQCNAGNRSALARLLTLVQTEPERVDASALNIASRSPPTPVIALTGNGGVGKSSLLGVLATRLSERGQRVGVLACDPESPVSGGALLGDRCRIATVDTTQNVFIRSLPTMSGQQAIANRLPMMLRVLRAFGFDWIFVETVGAGQGDIAVRDVADRVVLVVQPLCGDDLQWEKAGIVELADVIVVNKSDLPGADQTVADLKLQFHGIDVPTVPIIKTSTAKDQGIEELIDKLLGL